MAALPLPVRVPFLPGNSIKDVQKQDFRKAHTLDFKNGYSIKRDPSIGIGGDPLPARDLTLTRSEKIREESLAKEFAQLTYGKRSKEEQLLSTAAFVPAYVAYDKLVLRFEAYFKQTVHESKEQFHLRRVRILYFVEDDSIAVVEPPQENSGIPQGVLIKRQRLPKGDGKSFYEIKDLNRGVNVTFYGKTFRIVDCDRFTERYMTQSLGLPLNAPEQPPSDPYLASRAQSYKIPRRVQASDKLYKFLLHDRHVLRFRCVWDDRDSMFGELREFVLHYYLVDDCVEVREVHSPNEGREPFPVLLRRQPLPKVFNELSDLTEKEKYTWQDLAIGRYINVLNRPMLIYDCDEYTRSYYRDHLPDLDPQSLEPLPIRPVPESSYTVPSSFSLSSAPASSTLDASQAAATTTLPPYNGWGDEEDSRGNCRSLIPKVPKKDFIKMLLNEHKILRFAAVLRNPSAEDKDRKFVVSYRLADDTMLVYEPHQRNSGIIGGKFLERTRLLLPTSTLQNPAYYTSSLLRVGRSVHAFGREFLLVDADDFVFEYMESRADLYPASDRERVLGIAREVARENKEAAKLGGEEVKRMQAVEIVREAFGQRLDTHELITLVRLAESDGVVSLAKLESLLS